jgi:hypothetical protein
MNLIPQIFLFIPGEWCMVHHNSDGEEIDWEAFVSCFVFSKFKYNEKNEFT